MAEQADLEARIQRLEDIEAIKRLKYKYARCLDCKDWDRLAECFTEDAVVDYSQGKFHYEGTKAILQFLTDNLGSHDRITSHQMCQPEIELTSPTTANGSWAMRDYVIDKTLNIGVSGAAFYYDEYVKRDGEWRMKSTGYTRIFEEIGGRAGLTLTAVKEYGTPGT